ncbi:hypothetical protein [Cedecea neteri]|nr:hypothetical protein [Cedecea neteri]
MLATSAYADGAAVATKLNDQWLSSADKCTNSSGDLVSALACSGVLVKPLPNTNAENAMAAGSALYLRKDLKHPGDITGIILPGNHALNADEKGLSAACVRPLLVDNHVVRDAFGCGKETTTPKNNDDTDVSTCNQQGYPEAIGWKWNGECSLSVLIYQEFSRAMKLNQDNSINKASLPMQVWYRHWPDTMAKAMPQALVYTAGKEEELKARQRDRARLYSDGSDVPILKYTPENASPFSYSVTDDEIPTEKSVQEKLNKLFEDKHSVRFTVIAPSYTANNKVLSFLATGTDGTIPKGPVSYPYSYDSLAFDKNNHVFTSMGMAFRNMSSNAPMYGFILDTDGKPAASVYGPKDSDFARRSAIALAQAYNTRTDSMLPVAGMNAQNTGNSSSQVIQTGVSPFEVIRVGGEADIKKDPTSLYSQVQEVTSRYNDTRASCKDNSPAWQCSGLIARATGAGHPFTQTEDVVKNRGVASYFFLRADTLTNNSYANQQGIILKVPDSASIDSSAGKQLLAVLKDRVKCIYPHDAQTDHNFGIVNDFQCHKNNTRPGDITSDYKDYSDCSSELGLLADTKDIDQWTDKWHAKKYTWSYNQCAFSTQHAVQFYAAIWLTGEHVGDYTWNEMILAPSSHADDIPDLDAAWYSYGNPGAQKDAKTIAQKYHDDLHRSKIPTIAWDYQHSAILFDLNAQTQP